MKKKDRLCVLFTLAAAIVMYRDLFLGWLLVLQMFLVVKWVNVVRQETIDTVTKELKEGFATVTEQIKDKSYNNKDRFSIN